MNVLFVLFGALFWENVVGVRYNNDTLTPTERQLLQFKLHHPKPVGLLTLSTGAPVEIRDTVAINSMLIANQLHLEYIEQVDHERRPERVVHAKGIGALGYFEVTHDVSKYTSADVFNGIGKKTEILGRFSTAIQGLGGNDLSREMKGLAIKFYTKEGILDLLCLHLPLYFYNNPLDFGSFVHAFKRNPKTTLFDPTAFWDFVTLRTINLRTFLWILSDFGLPDSYRRMNIFPIHTYETNDIHGHRYYIRFNFISEQGIGNLTNEQARAIGDPDYYTKDLYNAIEQRDYPSWRLELDILSEHDIKNVDYNPFDVTDVWKNGTYKTVQVGRLVLDRIPENNFRDIELSSFNPTNLVPGIPGPVDTVFMSRRISYRDTQNYRLGVNHNKIRTNRPLYAKTYIRDGISPVEDNMKDIPNYYPNSFNGPLPTVQPNRPKERLYIMESNAVDLQPMSDFYNRVLANDAQRQRLANNTATSLATVSSPIQSRAVQLLKLIDIDLGNRVEWAIQTLGAINDKALLKYH